MKWTAEGGEPPASDAISRDVREQLGLELKVARRAVEVLVVEKVGE